MFIFTLSTAFIVFVDTETHAISAETTEISILSKSESGQSRSTGKSPQVIQKDCFSPQFNSDRTKAIPRLIFFKLKCKFIDFNIPEATCHGF